MSLVDRFPRFEHLEIRSTMKRSVYASMASFHPEPPPTGHIPKGGHIQARGGPPRVPTELGETIEESLLNRRREAGEVALGLVQEREGLLPGRERLGRQGSLPPLAPVGMAPLDFRECAALTLTLPLLQLPKGFGR